MKQKCIYSLLLISFVLNVIFFLSEGITYIRIKLLSRIESTSFPVSKDLKDFRDKIYTCNMTILTSGIRPDIPNFPEGITARIKYNLGIDQPKYPFFEGGEPNWVLLATLDEAISRKDIKSIAEIEKIFENHLLGKKPTEVDCALSGCSAIVLHKYTRKKTYKEYADMMLSWLIEHDTEYGILYRSNNKRFQLNDGYGMYMPFLNMYATAYNDSNARVLLKKQMEIATKYIMDPVSGIPVHGFAQNSSHSKVMMCNFGRGISWFVSGLIDIDTTLLSDSCKTSIAKLDTTLCELWKSEGCFSQFPGQGGKSDLSAELPIIYYLSHKGLIRLSKSELLKYSTMCDNGLLYHSSGSVSTKYSELTGPNILSQAFMLKLLNEYDR